jgi:peptidoglycan/xylan/chitin deacetylase (PgdA/CDA1 family)
VRRTAAAAALAALVLTAAGCGGGSGSKDDSATSGATSTTATAPAKKKHHKKAVVAPTPLTGDYHGRVPILMYHVITAPKPDTPLPELWTPWKTFIETMLTLKKAGYEAVTLDAVWNAWHGGTGLPKKPMVLTFDDGYLSHSTHARPTLHALGWPGVLYLEGKNIDPKVGLSKRQIRLLIANGWEIDAHTLTHPDLTTVGADQLTQEVAGSRKIIHKDFGVPVDNFAYPAGKYDATVEAAVKAAGFDTAVTVDPGVASKSLDPYALPRIRVNGSDTAAAVLARVEAQQ